MLNSRFNMKDMGRTDVIPGIKITKTLDGLILSQSNNADKILEKFNKDDFGEAKTSIDINQYLSKNKNENVSQVEYSRVIRSLMNLMSCT